DYFPAHCVHDRLRPEVCEFFRMDNGHGHHGVAAGGLHADADDEFADVEVRWPREEGPFRRIPAFRRTVLSPIPALFVGPSSLHLGDLRADVPLDLRLLPFDGTRLDSRG